MRSFSLLGLSCLFAVAVGCSQPPSSSELTLDPAVVKSQSSALAAAVSAAENDEGTNVAAQVGSLGNNVAALIPNTADGALGLSTSPVATGGSVSWSNGTIACNDLTFDVSALGATNIGGSSVTLGASHLAVTCNFTYASNSFAGTLHATGSTNVNGVAYTWDATFTATNVTFDSHDFTAGSVAVDATVTTNSSSAGAETFHATGSVSFPTTGSSDDGPSGAFIE